MRAHQRAFSSHLLCSVGKLYEIFLANDVKDILTSSSPPVQLHKK